MVARVGVLDGKLYYDASGVGGSSWSLGTNVKDLTLNIEKGEADATTRAASGWRVLKGTIKDATIEFEMNWDTSDSLFAAVRSAFTGDTVIGFAVVDGAIATPGTQGLQADYEITGFNINEPLEEVITVGVTARPSADGAVPSWLTVT